MNVYIRHCLSAVALTLLLGGCSTAPPGSRGSGGYGSATMPSRLSPAQAEDITIYALGLVDTPYRYGGNTPDAGFDCSGLIGHVYRSRAGVTPPRTVASLKNWGWQVRSDSIRSGDLVLFGRNSVVSHAGIYVGGGRFVHAPSTGGTVRLDDLNSTYWAAQQLTFRRP